MRRRAHPLASALTVLLAVGLLAGCGGGNGTRTAGSGTSTATQKSAQKSAQCKAQWRQVGESIIGLDQDPEPSALASRWTTVLATVDYYQNRDQIKDCQQTVENQVKAITALRQFTEKLRPYDMAYQHRQTRASIDLYLHEPVPAPSRDENGKLVPAPGKVAVVAAYRILSRDAAAADADLQAGWAQMASVDLKDVTALRSALTDLDGLAQTSPAWQRCEAALQVLVAAIRAQEAADS